MGKPRVRAGGGVAAMLYTLKKGREAGGVLKLYRRLRTRNACKTCAVGMGGQKGGMVNEAGHFPEVCKKSVQAQAGDMAGAIEHAFFAHTSIDALAGMTSAELEKLGRLTFPILAEPGDRNFRRISWDDAMARTAKAFRESSPGETFFYSSGRSSNEAAFLLQLVARAYGTNNVNNCSYYCHQASGVALGMVYGSGTASISLDDLDHADLALVAGANPASNHPRLITKLVELRGRGGKVLVVNPLRELGLERFRVPSKWRSMIFGSKIADLYLQPHIGADVAVFQALLKGLIERGAVDAHFIGAASEGWDAVRADAVAASWDELSMLSGLPRSEIDAAVAMIAGAKRGIFMWAMGLTHHENGVDNVLALANLALARGWLGREGAGLLPIRGHSNVQGVGSCGVAPALKQAFAASLEQIYRINLPTDRGLDTYASMVAADEGRIRATLLLGGNLFASNPDRTWAAGALRNIPFSVTVSTKLNEGHVHGRGQTAVILPALARDEEAQMTTQESMFNFVRVSDGGTAAVPGEMRSEVEILSALAERILPAGRFDWSSLRSHRTLRDAISRCVPGYGAVREVDTTKREFEIEGRTFHETRFPTPSGRAAFHRVPLPDRPSGDAPLRLMTLRSEGQFNTVVYDEEDLYRGNTSRDVLMMASDDARALGVGEGDRVRVESKAGEMMLRVAITKIRPGNVAAYYPEANVLVDRRIDPRSKTPAFKSVDVKVRPLAAGEGR
jgi:molybdopterin-dependent oxidoreductase alpha subunit